MSTNSVVGGTPYYVLMDGFHRIGPAVVKLHTGFECSPVYGFSGKNAYDKFCTNSQLALKPYPLVKGYLRNQARAPSDGLNLVVLDAAGPRDVCLHAATMEAVLEAQEKRTTHVTAEYRLILDQTASTYRVDGTSVQLGDVVDHAAEI